MFKRARWVGTGAALGFGASLWVQRRLRRLAARYRPAGMAGAAAGRVRDVPGDLRDAIREGRATMQEREAELRRTVWATEATRSARSPGATSTAAPSLEPGQPAAVVRSLPPPGSAQPRRGGPRRRAIRP